MEVMIATQIAGCAPAVFDNPMLAVEFVRMIYHLIAPEQFVSLASSVYGEEGTKLAEAMTKACVGTGA